MGVERSLRERKRNFERKRGRKSEVRGGGGRGVLEKIV